MEKPVVAAKSPAVLELEAGEYWWCACGRSRRQPFCDGSHKGTGITPRKVELTEKKRLAFCNCKQSGHAPMCDGSHARIT